MIELTPDQRQTVAHKENGPHRVLDPDTRTVYVLVREEVYDRARALFAEDDDDRFVENMYPHVMEVFGRAGWDDPAMDIYNDLDPRKQS